jgi:hypothetical protein
VKRAVGLALEGAGKRSKATMPDNNYQSQYRSSKGGSKNNMFRLMLKQKTIADRDREIAEDVSRELFSQLQSLQLLQNGYEKDDEINNDLMAT